jgi:hypothetical protein
MKKYLMTVTVFFIFTLVGYSQDTMLAIVGKKVSVSKHPVTAPMKIDTLVNTVTDRGKIIDTILILHMIEHITKASYKVSELICGDLKKDTVTFVFHYTDHVSSSNDMLLFLSKNDEDYILKRKPVEVYKTVNNRWACLYTTEMDKYSQIKFQKLRFKPELAFDISMYNDEYIKKHYPSPYYKIKKYKAVAVQGIYADEFSQKIIQENSSGALNFNK